MAAAAAHVLDARFWHRMAALVGEPLKHGLRLESRRSGRVSRRDVRSSVRRSMASSQIVNSPERSALAVRGHNAAPPVA